MLNPEGVISPDFAEHALVGHDSRLRVWAVDGNRQLHSWPLPEVPAAILPEPIWACDQESCASCLVLRYGGAWGPGERGDRRDRSVAGLIFVRVSSGESRVVHLPRQEVCRVRHGLQLHVGPGKGHVLVQHDVDGKQQAMSVYTCYGGLVNCALVQAHTDDDWQCFWPQSGAAVAVVGRYYASCHLWLLSTRSISRMQTRYGWAAWATPSSDSLLLARPGTTARYRLSGELAPVLDLQAFDTARYMVWGCRLAVLATDGNTSYLRRLQVYTVHEGVFSLQNTLSASDWHFHYMLQLSPDGELCAAVLESDWSLRNKDGLPTRRHLAIVALASGVMHESPLLSAELADGLAYGWLAATFSTDCTAVLVSDTRSHRSQVFRFRTDT